MPNTTSSRCSERTPDGGRGQCSLDAAAPPRLPCAPMTEAPGRVRSRRPADSYTSMTEHVLP
ncbi:MAG: hypothetical protein MUF34_38470, partial [Polyangiaceae bacterium]|nr:hypothetical protein [Polyangiaceae bacterium]